MKRTNTAVWMEKHKRWQINVQKDNERRSFYSSIPGRNGQREANKKADEWLDDEIISPNTKVKTLYDNWIAELEVTTSTGHARQYKHLGKNHILPKNGNKKISSLTEQHLQSVIIAGFQKGLAKKTLMDIKSCMTAFIKYCRKCKATKLIVENLSIPKNAPVGERTILQPKDLIILFNRDTTTLRGKEVIEPFINAYRLEVVTGLRPGETIGLMLPDIKGDIIHIKRSINFSNETTKGKNDNADREFVLTDLAKKIISDQKAMLLKLGIESQYLFPDKYGDAIKQPTYNKHWRKYREGASISQASPYELRHTFVSIVKKLPVGLIKSLVGHSEDMDTYGTYGHAIDGEMRTTADLIQSTFSDILKA